jgi:WD40 repeat protein
LFFIFYYNNAIHFWEKRIMKISAGRERDINSTFRTAILAIVFIIIASCETTFAGPLFCAVGFNGTFAVIDAGTGEISGARTDLPLSLQSIAVSPSGTYYTINYFDSVPTGIWTLDPRTGDTDFLMHPQSIYPIRGMAFSPDGKLYVTRESYSFALGIINLENGSYRTVGGLSGDNIQADGLDFSPDGQLYGTVGGKLYTIDITNGYMHQVGTGRFLESSFSLAFTPDGDLYATGYDFGSTYPNYSYAFVQVDPLTGNRIGEAISLPGADRGLAYIPEPMAVLLFGLSGIMLRLYSKDKRNRNC